MENILAIDIGGTSIKIGVVCGSEILEKTVIRNTYKGKQDQLLNGIKSMCNNFIKRFNITKIGVGCPGEIVNNIVLFASNLGWKDYHILEDFQKTFPKCQIFVENDGNAACQAEIKYGYIKDYKTGILVTIGRGIGGAIIKDCKVVSGDFNSGGQIGHMVTHFGGRKCNCGRKGCFETYASVYGLLRTIKETNYRWEKESEKIDDSNLSGFQVAKLKSMHNPIIDAGIVKWHKDIIEGLLNLCYIIDPSIIVLAGGITESDIIDIDMIRKGLQEANFGKCVVEISKFKGKTGLVGAAAIVK